MRYLAHLSAVMFLDENRGLKTTGTQGAVPGLFDLYVATAEPKHVYESIGCVPDHFCDFSLSANVPSEAHLGCLIQLGPR